MSAVAAEPAGVPRARMMLQRAHWAATAFADYDHERTRRIVEAVADEAYRNAQRYAEWAVKETGMGVVEHKRRKNEACSRGLVEWYGDQDYVSARIDPEAKIVELPRPAGGRGARAHAVDEPDRDRLLQGAAGAHDPKRRRRQPAPDRA
jgi:acyl-CoA reductase-like NAD-dependent aldehyde dehydrogenase